MSPLLQKLPTASYGSYTHWGGGAGVGYTCSWNLQGDDVGVGCLDGNAQRVLPVLISILVSSALQKQADLPGNAGQSGEEVSWVL